MVILDAVEEQFSIFGLPQKVTMGSLVFKKDKKLTTDNKDAILPQMDAFDKTLKSAFILCICGKKLNLIPLAFTIRVHVVLGVPKNHNSQLTN